MFLEICMQIHSVIFALRRQINKQKYAKTINLLYAGNKLFVKFQAEGGVLIPSPLAHGLAEYQLSALQASISEVNTINATTQQFITAKKYQAAH